MTHTLRVEPLVLGQEDTWLALNDDDSFREKLLTLLTTPDREKREFLLVYDGDQCIGRLRGAAIAPSEFTIRGFAAVDDNRQEDVTQALGNWLYDSFSAGNDMIVSWETVDPDTMLEQAGFQKHRRKIYVNKTLDGYTSPYDDPFTYRTLREIGRDEFLAVLTAASEGDMFEEEHYDPEREFDELIERAGLGFTPDHWQLAFLDGVPAGVILPQIYHDAPHKGTLFYIGLLPLFRGRGLGKILHAAGLEYLAGLPVSTYIGSTDIRNTPMTAVFQRNGCTIKEDVQVFYKADGRTTL
jgi:RimJ/RimL family protein N-acetyltransferase